MIVVLRVVLRRGITGELLVGGKNFAMDVLELGWVYALVGPILRCVFPTNR